MQRPSVVDRISLIFVRSTYLFFVLLLMAGHCAASPIHPLIDVDPTFSHFYTFLSTAYLAISIYLPTREKYSGGGELYGHVQWRRVD